MKVQTFYYKAYIMRGNRKICREGSLQEKYPLDALDRIVAMSTDVWEKPLVKIELYEISKNGELVATSTTGDRINAVLATNAKLNPSKFKSIAERRKIANKAIKPEDKKTVLRRDHTEEKKVVSQSADNEYNWCVRHCTRYIPDSFLTLKTYNAT